MCRHDRTNMRGHVREMLVHPFPVSRVRRFAHSKATTASNSGFRSGADGFCLSTGRAASTFSLFDNAEYDGNHVVSAKICPKYVWEETC